MITTAATLGSGVVSAAAKAACQDNLIAAILRGESPPALANLTSSEIGGFLDRAWYHNVLALLYEALGGNRHAPPELVQSLHVRSRGLAVWELQHRKILNDVAAEFSRAGIEAICFKGTALAYAIYPKPYLRSRGDSDILIRPGDLAASREILARCGFKRAHALPGLHVAQEECWLFPDSQGVNHSIDLHWQISNSRLLSRHWSWDDLRATAEPLPALGGLLIPNRTTALLIACMHFAVHRGEGLVSPAGISHTGDRMFWLYDVKLLADRLTACDWETFLSVATAKSMCANAAEILALAQSNFDNNIPLEVMRALTRVGGRGTIDHYLSASPSRRELIDFTSIGQVRGMLGFVREVLLPPRAYLRAKYSDARLTSTPMLHLRRWFGGLEKRLRPRSGSDSIGTAAASIEVQPQ